MHGLDALFYAVLISAAGYFTWSVIAFKTPRRVWRKLPDNLQRFLQCPWCAGFWITVIIALATDLLVRDGIPAPVLVALAAATGTALLGEHDERLMTVDSGTD